MREVTSEKIIRVGWFLYDVERDMICLHRRDAKAPSHANMWDHFGGGVEDGDQTELDALLREVREELGLVIEKDNVIEISRRDGRAMYSIPFSIKRASEIELGEGAGFAWLTFEGALSLADLTPEAREGLSLLNTPSNTNIEVRFQ